MGGQALGHTPLVGLKLGHYRIAAKIGSGGMGEVYRAHDEHLDRDVAIKVLPPGILIDESARKHFHKEALILSQLNHPNIATIHDFDTQQDVDFLVMEYISGVTLSKKVAGGPLPEKELLRLGLQLAEGLCAAHEHGVVHCDLKPGNLKVAEDGRLKILDFGLARLRPHYSNSAPTVSVSESEVMGGTLLYMAPEQLLNGEIDARTDIHAAGLVLYEMATGQRPFAGVERSQLIGLILRTPPRPPTVINPRVSTELDRIICKCLEKDPENRYQSAKELAVDLRRLSTTGVATQIPAPRQVHKYPFWKITLLLVFIGLLLVGVGVQLLRPGHTHALTDRDTVVLADFANSTGDLVFDDALKQALAIQLQQSPFLNILSERKIRDTLQMMGRSTNERITMDVGRELCLRTGSKAVLGGAIASLGSHYLIDVNAVACGTGDTLAKEQAEAPSKENVLKALSRASSSMRTRLGESLLSVQKFDVPIEVTTSSLEALKNYSLAFKIMREKGDAPGIPFLKRAIELDPNFPMAYAALGSRYSNLGQRSLELEYTTRAYELRDRVSEREKLRISAAYFRATRELDRAVEAYELWIANYPRDSMAHNNLGEVYSEMGQFGRALREAQEVLRLAPESVMTYENLGNLYIQLDRLDEAKITLDQALARKLDGETLRIQMYYLAFLRGDIGQMEQQLAWASGKPGDEDQFLGWQSATEAYYGRLRKARGLTRHAVDSAVRADSKERAAIWQVNSALCEAELGNAAQARQGVKAALALSQMQDVKMVAALTLSRSGDVLRAKALADELEKSYPRNTMLRLYWLPTINAAIELNNGNSSQAFVDLEAPAPYELADLYPVYVRGHAYLLAHNGPAAAAEFQKLLHHENIFRYSLLTGALARLQIGRAYAMAGEIAKAKASYQDFLVLWKDADPDIPILRKAKAEYAKLQ